MVVVLNARRTSRDKAGSTSLTESRGTCALTSLFLRKPGWNTKTPPALNQVEQFRHRHDQEEIIFLRTGLWKKRLFVSAAMG